MDTKRVKKKEDRISDLPDAIIQHILSFLPSTKQSIQTTVLSKRWRNQWTQVPVLIFNSTHGMSTEKFLNFIDNTLLLHDCSKIHKFQLRCYDSCFLDEKDPRFAELIAFATTKYVEDLCLDCTRVELLLPEFLFNNDSLVKLTTHNCKFMPKGKVNWGCLSSLELVYCKLPDQAALERIVSGSPLLKSLKLFSSVPEKIVIASKSLNRLLIDCYYSDIISVLEISCPKLENLSLKHILTHGPQLLSQAIENVVSGSLLLESFELIDCRKLVKLVVASKPLKKLVSQDVRYKSIEISCPHLRN